MTAAGGDPRFRFGGRLSLDLTWTLRYRAVAPAEMLATPADLGKWVATALAPLGQQPGVQDLAAAVALRESVYEAATARLAGREVGRRARQTINDWAARPAPYRSLGGRSGALLRLRPEAELESALAAVALDAVELLSADDGRLRRCDGPGCSLVFYDSSRPGTRRWCSTERCGNRVNTTTYRRRLAGRASTT
ncbi:MAG: CGNR zinc finger domain-containing protein [Actinomycetes bacterium]